MSSFMSFTGVTLCSSGVESAVLNFGLGIKNASEDVRIIVHKCWSPWSIVRLYIAEHTTMKMHETCVTNRIF